MSNFVMLYLNTQNEMQHEDAITTHTLIVVFSINTYMINYQHKTKIYHRVPKNNKIA